MANSKKDLENALHLAIALLLNRTPDFTMPWMADRVVNYPWELLLKEKIEQEQALRKQTADAREKHAPAQTDNLDIEDFIDKTQTDTDGPNGYHRPE